MVVDDGASVASADAAVVMLMPIQLAMMGEVVLLLQLLLIRPPAMMAVPQRFGQILPALQSI